MYKLLLVEDEEDVRDGLIEEIHWESIGYEVVDSAENGREAMDLVDRYLPDVVVTDIHMPFMDGLQLASWIREHHPMIKIIILTGYDEFEYAQKAIKLQIDEYILKPFSSQELIEVLLKVKRHMEAEMAEKENVQILKEHYRKSIPVLRELFLSSMVTRKLTIHEIEEKSASYGMDLSGQAFMAAAIRIDYVHEDLDREIDQQMAGNLKSSVSLKYTEDRYLQLFAVYNVADEICQKTSGFKVFIHHDECVLLAVGKQADLEILAERMLTLLEEIRQNVHKYVKLTVTSGAGSVFQHIADVYQSYKEALQALDYRLILGNNRVIWINDVETRRYDSLHFDEQKEHDLVRSIKLGTLEELTATMDSLFSDLSMKQLSVKDCQVYLLEMLTSIMKIAKEFNIELEELFGSADFLFTDMFKYNNLQEVKQWAYGLCSKLRSSIALGRQSGYRQLVNDAKDYIRKHYAESDISIRKVCNHLHISTGYFSSIFKKEVKMTFVNYLMQIRMDAAKEMLRTGDMKAFEIAEKIGFADPNYFSFCFRKKFGISPKEYRNGSRGVEPFENTR
ncbi:response regulator [Paenibacillus pini]|uniref:Helix-turn-helix n=1 Tax=Paenibacillus pini JCM 16418 TaxID=1236976 RepID=W7YZ04_9BACL|nr:response regulator [Paenibacillus pini]GAF09881.1 helix-turn-helix [Paenibacillus pini JCM 16418]